MRPAVHYGSVEALAAAYLRPFLTGVYVSRSIPDPDAGGARARMVIVRNDGGPSVSLVTRVQRLGIRCFAPTPEEADQLADDVNYRMQQADGNAPFVRVTQTGGPYPVDEPSGASVRYATYEALTRGTP